MSGSFKMKGSPAKLGSIQGTAGHASALKQMSVREEYEAMKEAPGSPPDKLAAEYGGTWSKKEGRNAWTNEQGQTAKQAALAKNREKKAENKTSPAKQKVKGKEKLQRNVAGLTDDQAEANKDANWHMLEDGPEKKWRRERHNLREQQKSKKSKK